MLGFFSLASIVTSSSPLSFSGSKALQCGWLYHHLPCSSPSTNFACRQIRLSPALRNEKQAENKHFWKKKL
jgi:hypothetical protein